MQWLSTAPTHSGRGEGGEMVRGGGSGVGGGGVVAELRVASSALLVCQGPSVMDLSQGSGVWAGGGG